MKVGIPRLSVMVITYNQEDIIGRTLDSLLDQKDYLYEICVSDDCSSDGTWNVLLDYQKRNPDLIKLHRQEHNVGIFVNTEYQWTMPTGDIINEIAGDDVTPNGWYKTVIEYILSNNIDWKNELFCIYGDYKAIYPGGDSIVIKQNAIHKRPHDAMALALRGIISGRSCCYSYRILKRFENVSRGRSHIAEMAQDRQLQCLAEQNYYIPSLGNIYFTGIGVSSHLNEETLKERQQILPYAYSFFERKGIVIQKKERYYGMYIQASLDFRYNRKISSIIKALYYKLISADIRYLLLNKEYRFLIFSLLRRLPHNNPINL